MIAILFDSIVRSVSISVADHSSSSSSNTRIGLAVVILADSSHSAARHFYRLHGVRLPRVLFNVALMAWTRFQAHTGASRHGLTRFHVPFLGPLAERWLDEE
jgi:hypothetical protein